MKPPHTCLNQLRELEHLNELDDYYNHNWSKSVSYYNKYSTIFYAGKVKLRYGLPLNTPSGFFLSPCNTLILQVNSKDPIFHLITPKSLGRALEIGSSLKGLSKYPVIFHAPDFSPRFSRLKILREYEQIVYSCHDIVDGLESDIYSGSTNYLSSRKKSTFRKNITECHFRAVKPNDECNIEVILDYWAKSANLKGKKHNLFKDYQSLRWAVKEDSDKLRAYIGFRGKHPISYSLFVESPGFPNVVTQLISKSLNYRIVPGGYNETSVWELYQCCKRSIDDGIQYINASDAGPEGLRAFKEKFKANSIKCYDWILQ